MNKVNLALLLTLLASSVYLVRVSYDARRLFAELDQAQTEARQLEIEQVRLKAEKQSQATPLRVERVARDKLAMHTPTPSVTQYVGDPSSSIAAKGPQ